MSKQSQRPSQQRAVNKYIRKNYDRLAVFVKKGKKEEYSNYAAKHGFKSLNSFIVHCIEKFIELSEKSDNSVDPDSE